MNNNQEIIDKLKLLIANTYLLRKENKIYNALSVEILKTYEYVKTCFPQLNYDKTDIKILTIDEMYNLLDEIELSEIENIEIVDKIESIKLEMINLGNLVN